jgi:hypothetical protein
MHMNVDFFPYLEDCNFTVPNHIGKSIGPVEGEISVRFRCLLISLEDASID